MSEQFTLNWKIQCSVQNDETEDFDLLNYIGIQYGSEGGHQQAGQHEGVIDNQKAMQQEAQDHPLWTEHRCFIK